MATLKDLEDMAKQEIADREAAAKAQMDAEVSRNPWTVISVAMIIGFVAAFVLFATVFH